MITEKIAATVSRHKMLTPNQRVLVALSGGADSTALLLSLRELGYGVYARAGLFVQLDGGERPA